MIKPLPSFRRIASFIGIAISLVACIACEKFDDTDPYDYTPLPKPLPDMILYTTSDGAPVNVDSWKNDILDNCYYDGMGRIILKEGVTEIPDCAFCSCPTLLDVALPETITVIGVSAFRNSRLRSIVIPDSVVSLRELAFYNCNDLARIVIPNSVTSMGESVFLNCRNLSNAQLSKNLTSIPKNTFYGCSSLRNINIPDNITEIDNDAFSCCHSLEKIVLPSGVKQINSFNYCSSLKEVVFGPDIKIICGFSGCTSLKKMVLPKGLEKIYSYTFSYCTELEQVDIPATVQIIGGYAFDYCPKLKTINLPEGIEYIGNNLFANCHELSEIRIPESVLALNFGAFQSTNISHIHIPDNVIYIENGAFIGMNKLQSFSGKFVTDDGRCVITNDNILKGFAGQGLTCYEFPEGLQKITDFSTPNYDIESLTLPSSIESISSIWISLYSFKHLKAIYCKATTPPYFHFDVLSDEQPSITVYVPRASVEAYKQSSSWGIFNIEGCDF